MPDLLSNTLAFVFALGVIIFVHEAGHLIVAKLFDTRVLTFSLGFSFFFFAISYPVYLKSMFTICQY